MKYKVGDMILPMNSSEPTEVTRVVRHQVSKFVTKYIYFCKNGFAYAEGDISGVQLDLNLIRKSVNGKK